MNEYQTSYYKEMEKRDRLIRIYDGDRLAALITYFLGEKDIRQDMWQIPQEDTSSHVLTIDHLLSKLEEKNTRIIFAIWHDIKTIFKEKHPQANRVIWRKAGKGERQCSL